MFKKNKNSNLTYKIGTANKSETTTLLTFHVWHKLNNFLICEFFWVLIVNYDKKLINSCSQPSLIPDSLQIIH